MERRELRSKEGAAMNSQGQPDCSRGCSCASAQVGAPDPSPLHPLPAPKHAPLHTCMGHQGHTQTPFCRAQVIPGLIQQTFIVCLVSERPSRRVQREIHSPACGTQVHTRVYCVQASLTHSCLKLGHQSQRVRG